MSVIDITISVDNDWSMEVGDIWPDGAPEQIDADAVVSVIRESGTVARMLRDWYMIDDLSVKVVVRANNPHHKQDEALFPELAAPSVLITQAEFRR